MASDPKNPKQSNARVEVADEDSRRVKSLLQTVRSAEGSRLTLRFKQGDAINEWLGLAFIGTDGLETLYTLDDIARISEFKKSYLSKMASVATAFKTDVRQTIRKRLVTFTDLYYAYQYMEKMPTEIDPLKAVDAILQAKKSDAKNPVQQALIDAEVLQPAAREAWTPPENIEIIDDPFPYLTKPPARVRGMQPDRKELRAFESSMNQTKRSLARICGGTLEDRPNMAISIVVDDWNIPHLTGWQNALDAKSRQCVLATMIEYARHQMTAEEFKSSVQEVFGEIDETIGQWDVFFEENDPEAKKRSQLRKLEQEIAKLQEKEKKLRDGLIGSAYEWPDLSEMTIAKGARVAEAVV